MEEEFSFEEQQKILEKRKSELKQRVSDEYIVTVINRLKERDFNVAMEKNDSNQISKGLRINRQQDPVMENYTQFRPLVAFAGLDGQEIPTEELLEIFKDVSFPNKKIILNEIIKGRVVGTIQNGSLSLAHKGTNLHIGQCT